MIGDEIELAHRLHEMIGEHDSLEQGTVSLSIATFRYVPADLRESASDDAVANYLNELNARIVTAIRLSGEAFLSNAYIGERFMLRACIVNFRTTLKDVAVLPPLVIRLGRELDANLRPRVTAATPRSF
jgi:glutamate/tyrosine decarboxylase-like PLP-dependent enzyme